MARVSGSWLWAAVGVAGLLVGGATVVAEETLLQKLNPFDSPAPSRAKAARPTTRPAAKKESSWLGLPKFGSSQPATKKPVTRKAEPSLWDRTTRSTKQAFQKTKNALTPGQAEPAPKPLTGYGTKKPAGKPAVQEESKSSILPTSWWKRNDAPAAQPKPRTPSEWLGGKRPEEG